MKLSKARQEVVDKMREGWTLYAGLETGASWMKPAPRSKERAVVGWFDFKQLLQEGIIEPQTKFTPTHRKIQEQ